MSGIAPLLRAAVEQTGDPQLIVELEGLEKRVDRFSNAPGVLKGLGKVDFSDGLCSTALDVVRGLLAQDDDSSVSVLEQHVDASLFDGWAAITLAARADQGVIDEVAEALQRDYAVARIRELRRLTAKALERQAAPVSDQPNKAPEDDAPASVGKVKAWLADHSNPDPLLLAPRPKQRAGARAAAIRALGQIGTPAAFEVLKQYATDEPSSQVLDEVLRAWDSFDRRVYAAAMLIPARGHLDLTVVKRIDGLDAVEEMTSLRIIADDKKDDQTDVTPLAACTQLRALEVQWNGPGAPTDIEWLRSLPGLRALCLTGPMRRADLSPLAESNIERLDIWFDGQTGSILLDMPKLTHLTVIGGAHDNGAGITAHPEASEIVLTLARRGVPVMVYDFDRPWVHELLPAAENAGLQVTAGHGVQTIHLEGASVSGGEPLPGRLFV